MGCAAELWVADGVSIVSHHLCCYVMTSAGCLIINDSIRNLINGFQVFTIINLLAVTSQFSTRPTTTSTIATPLHSAEENGPSLPPAGIWDGTPAEVLFSVHRWQCCFSCSIFNTVRLRGNEVMCRILLCLKVSYILIYSFE